MGFDRRDVLMVGLGASTVCYYRVLLPAHALGIDYVGLSGDPPKTVYRTGLVDGDSRVPDFGAYKLVVLQQPHGDGWLAVIEELRAHGVKVAYELDDNLHAIHDQEDHAFRASFPPDELPEWEKCIRACDALIVSTPFLREQYRRFNKKVYVCRNGIDPQRYKLTRPARDTVNIGWAGATGHAAAIGGWLDAIGAVLDERPNTCFVSIGQAFARAFEPYFGRRAITVPWAAIEQYPSAMTLLDVALAPAGDSGFYRGKSDLRWLEAGALGIPLIGDPRVYRDIRPGVDGFHATSPEQVYRRLLELVDDPVLRAAIGGHARRRVLAERAFPRAAEQWRRAFRALVH